MTLLLGPPGSGKSTLLLALAGKLDINLKQSGSITYNGHRHDGFCVQRTSAYISQTDNHLAELTVRESLDFAARCQGASEGFSGYIEDLDRLEKERNIRPSPEIDAFMKASSVGGKKHSVSTDYALKVLGLDVCSDAVVGNDMLRGISGEMVVGPRKALFMDEISTGLDSSTTYQIVRCFRNFVHQMEATVLMALLQPAPETFELFDDLVLLSEGCIVYQGPRAEVLEFFEMLGFRLPPSKGVAEFLQEVTSRKDQAQYWADASKPYVFLSAPEIAEAFKSSRFGNSLESSLSVPYDKCRSHPLALSKIKFAVSKLELFKACFGRELLLISRHRFLYIFRTCQVAFVGFVTCTLFLRTRLPLMISRLPVFYKQRDNFFHPASAWSVTSWILRVPYSIIEAVVWSCVVYYTVGFAPGFSDSCLYFFCTPNVTGSFPVDGCSCARYGPCEYIWISCTAACWLYSCWAALSSRNVAMIKPWCVWAFWLSSPLSKGQSAISVNEFTALTPKRSAIGNDTVGYNILNSHSLPTVFYRERAAGMYSSIADAAAQGLVEIPYIVMQTLIYGVITYFMINFERTIRKFVLYLLFMFLTFTYFTFYGMMVVGLTPSQHLVAVISSAFYSLWGLLAGFFVPKPAADAPTMASSDVKQTLGDLNEDSFVSLLSKLIGEAKYVQNNPPELIPEEDRVVKHVLDALLPYSTTTGGGPLVVNHVTYHPGRGNLIVEYPGTVPGKILSFVGCHMDVVTANPNDWEFDPFSLSIDGDKLRGRGTTDCLGHVALVTELMKRLGEKKPKLKSTVVAVFIANEENSAISGVGVDALVKDGLLNKLKEGPLFWIDTADKQPCIGTGGMIPWKLKVTGKLFHSGLAHKAINPLELAMEALKEMQSRFYRDFPPHPKEQVYGFATPSTMKPTQWSYPGGGINQIPAECTISGDVRLTPFYDVKDVIKKLQEYVDDINDNIEKLDSRGPVSKYVLPDENLRGRSLSLSLSLPCMNLGNLTISFDEAMSGVACDLNSRGFHVLCKATEEVVGHVKPYSITGSLPLIRELQDEGFDVQTAGYGLMATYHAKNEYCLLFDMCQGYQVFVSVISQLEDSEK
ncbi:hypothetical protein FH972_012428 [Carpinus fangiana]|uniref:Acetylornithine deacetylase n=1 Tax=Carpinus fangiana TaxID=176857 RepID=A0A5N6R3R0_9ROSI|nr:hypothetical protein FH972_012428 [Carpinus fangiana]